MSRLDEIKARHALAEADASNAQGWTENVRASLADIPKMIRVQRSLADQIVALRNELREERNMKPSSILDAMFGKK